MNLSLTQNMRLSQEMKLSPRMIQAMEILQLPMLALQERIDAEMESNPVLELCEDEDSPATEAGESETATDFDDRGEKLMVVSDERQNVDDFSRLDDMTAEFGHDFANPDAPALSRRESLEASNRKLEAMANTPAPSESLDEYLCDQWRFVDASENVKKAGFAVIEEIDSAGYLRTPAVEIADRLDMPDEDRLAVVNRAISLVQTLEPVGVGAIDLRQCLLIQLDAMGQAGQDVTLPRQIVSQFLRELEMNRLPAIARKLNCTIDSVKAAIVVIGRLNPRPGDEISTQSAQVIIPDLIVYIDENDKIVIKTAGGYIPDLTVSKYYIKEAKNKTNDRQTRSFLQKNIRSAHWLMDAIAQRQMTICRVAEEVFNFQREFLEKGVEALKPLPMSLVAEKIGVHPATVSRAVAEKYVETPRGIFPLRMFFSGGTTSQDGHDMSWDAVKAKLREIVDAEDKSRPLSDEKLADELEKAGLTVARRTIAKYREQLDIPPARQRKEF